ncbi:hypothetical protein [Psychrilyobacter sp.]|uniref:hypothetical protein n=1 Tax=Psychrilyobacter sp. TaxID=2586924 RepID=UPI003015C40C
MKKTPEKKELKKEKKERFIYLGPFLLKEGINTGSVFIGVPKELKELKKKYKGIERLFISVKDIAKAKSDVKKEGATLHTTFNSVLGEIKKQMVEVAK